MRATATQSRAADVARRFARDLLDPLTGLPNRGGFMDQLEEALAQRRGALAVFCIDLDRFKLVNDSLGHEAGDRLLVEVARRLHRTVRTNDTVARLGGDEFIVLCEDCPDAATAHAIAERLNAALSEPVQFDGTPVVTSGSIGVLLVGEPAGGAADVMRDADAAMHVAKRRGKARYELFEAGMRGPARERLELEADLRRALGNAELVPLLPARRRRADGRHPRGRGARALAAPRARPDRAGGLPPDRRGDGPDRAARPPGAARGVRARRSAGARTSASTSRSRSTCRWRSSTSPT